MSNHTEYDASAGILYVLYHVDGVSQTLSIVISVIVQLVAEWESSLLSCDVPTS